MIQSNFTKIYYVLTQNNRTFLSLFLTVPPWIQNNISPMYSNKINIPKLSLYFFPLNLINFYY